MSLVAEPINVPSTPSDPSEVEFDCSSYEILTQSDQHNNHCQSPKYDAAIPGVTENKYRTENSISLSMSNSGLSLDDSGTEADNEGRIGPVSGRKDGQRGIRRRNQEVPAGGDYQIGSMRTYREVLRILIEAGILLGVYFLSYQSSTVWEERRWRQKGKEINVYQCFAKNMGLRRRSVSTLSCLHGFLVCCKLCAAMFSLLPASSAFHGIAEPSKIF